MGSLQDTFDDIRNFGWPFFFRRLLPRTKDGLVEIKTPIGRIFVRPYDSDSKVFRDIFVRKHYNLSQFQQNARIRAAYDGLLAEGHTPVIVDAGANVGASTLWFAKEFPRAKVIAVEPDAVNAAICRLNTRDVVSVQVVEAAIGADSGRANVGRPSKNAKAWSVRTERDTVGSVPVVSMDALLDMGGAGARLFLTKIDIEGAEDDLFSKNLGWLEQAYVVIVELHDWMLPGSYNSANLKAAIMPLKVEMLISGEDLILIK